MPGQAEAGPGVGHFLLLRFSLCLSSETKHSTLHHLLFSLQDSEFTFESPWPTHGEEIVLVANSKNLMERQEVFAAVVAGAVTGVVLAATLASLLIYKWHKKSDVSYILGRQKASNTY